jgi:Rad3-related DNA helicase
MVGMPYPNRGSPELQEKMAYLNSTQGSHAGWYYPRNVHISKALLLIGI